MSKTPLECSEIRAKTNIGVCKGCLYVSTDRQGAHRACMEAVYIVHKRVVWCIGGV